MAKAKRYFFCRECGYQSSSWLGRCPECGKWNTFDEEVVQASTQVFKQSSNQAISLSAPIRIEEVKYDETVRIQTHCSEFDRVLGGGIVPGSLLLLGGEPGIGKSTLLLQTALSMQGKRLLYVSGEESEQQIKMRADRIGKPQGEMYVVSETATQRIFEHIEAVKPELLIIDSIQTISSEEIDSSAGSISQIRECTTLFQRYAKLSGVPVLLIGHITKDGTLAGPKVMEHIVDAVLQFEGDRNYGFRILRALKNRFGSTAELGIFEMQSDGLREVPNPSEILLSQRDETLSGSAVSATLEGARPIFIEVQSLVSSAVYGTPQRNMRGGTANCSVVVSDEPVGSPLVDNCDVLIAMNLPSLDKFERTVKPGGLIVVNSSIIDRKVQRDDVRVVYCDAAGIADAVKNPKGANVAILGAMMGADPDAVEFDKMVEAIKIELGERKMRFLEGNKAALVAGMDAAKA